MRNRLGQGVKADYGCEIRRGVNAFEIHYYIGEVLCFSMESKNRAVVTRLETEFQNDNEKDSMRVCVCVRALE